MSNESLDWWRTGTLYQIYPRSFADAGARGWGDLEGIRQRLPYVASLGVDAVWISPFFKSPMKDFGYDVEDHYVVDPMFGPDEDFDRLVDDARKLGLKIMVDLVLSHTADTHPWFVDAGRSRDSEYSDYFVWADPQPDGSPPNNWLSIFGGSAWAWHPTRRQYYLHNFLFQLWVQLSEIPRGNPRQFALERFENRFRIFQSRRCKYVLNFRAKFVDAVRVFSVR